MAYNPNNGFKSVNEHLKFLRRGGAGKLLAPVNTAANAARQKVGQALAPINQAAYQARQIRKQIETYIVGVTQAVNQVIDTGFAVYRVITGAHAFFAEKFNQIKKLSIKKLVADAVNGVVQEIKNTVSTLIGTVSNVINETIDQIESTYENFTGAIKDTFTGIDDLVTAQYNSIRDNVIDEIEVGRISGGASEQYKKDLEAVSTTIQRNFYINPDLEIEYKNQKGLEFMGNLTSGIANFDSPNYQIKRDNLDIKNLQDIKSNDDKVNMEFNNTDQSNLVTPTYDASQVLDYKSKIYLEPDDYFEVPDLLDPLRGNVRVPQDAAITQQRIAGYKFANRINFSAKEEKNVDDLIETERVTVALPPMDSGEFFKFLEGGDLPDRFKNLQSVIALNYFRLFGSRDPNSIMICSIKNNMYIDPETYDFLPEVNGDRAVLIERLIENGAIGHSSEVTTYDPQLAYGEGSNFNKAAFKNLEYNYDTELFNVKVNYDESVTEFGQNNRTVTYEIEKGQPRVGDVKYIDNIQYDKAEQDAAVQFWHSPETLSTISFKTNQQFSSPNKELTSPFDDIFEDIRDSETISGMIKDPKTDYDRRFNEGIRKYNEIHGNPYGSGIFNRYSNRSGRFD